MGFLLPEDISLIVDRRRTVCGVGWLAIERSSLASVEFSLLFVSTNRIRRCLKIRLLRF